jgi:hypothetical protein
VREIYRSDYFIMTVDEERRLLRRTRTALAFPTAADAETSYQELLQAMDTIDRSTHVLLVDMRLAPPRNDEAFERVVDHYYARLYSGFPRIAALLKTQAGRLQIMRILQGFKFPLQAFFDESEALAFLGIPGDGVKQGASRSIRRD